MALDITTAGMCCWAIRKGKINQTERIENSKVEMRIAKSTERCRGDCRRVGRRRVSVSGVQLVDERVLLVRVGIVVRAVPLF